MNLPERALTLYQPWAWLVAGGWKPIENRPPGFSHKSFRGDFWIHAGKRPESPVALTALESAADLEPSSSVPCRGFQGFWRVPAPVIERLKAAA